MRLAMPCWGIARRSAVPPKPQALPYQNRNYSQPANLGSALCGQAAQAQRIAERISKQFPADTMWNAVKMPALQAASELKRNHAAKAIELLQSAAPYRRRYPYVCIYAS